MHRTISGDEEGNVYQTLNCHPVICRLTETDEFSASPSEAYVDISGHFPSFTD